MSDVFETALNYSFLLRLHSDANTLPTVVTTLHVKYTEA